MPSKKAATTKSAGGGPGIGEAKALKSDRRAASPRRPRWSSVYDDQRRAIETAREEGVEEIAIVIERRDKQVARFEMKTEMLAEMLAQLSLASSSGVLQPSDRLATSMREAEGPLPVFRTKEELFDALEAAD